MLRHSSAISGHALKGHAEGRGIKGLAISGRTWCGDVAASGFTLVEVMVALAVVALAVTALLTAMMRHVDGSAHLRDKLFAHWVALNRIEMARLENRHTNRLPERDTKGTEQLAGRTWQWRAVVVETQAEGAVQLRVSVTDNAAADAVALATLSAVLDVHHRWQP